MLEVTNKMWIHMNWLRFVCFGVIVRGVFMTNMLLKGRDHLNQTHSCHPKAKRDLQ